MAILFDLDGTLLDTAKDFYTALNKLSLNLSGPKIAYNIVRNLVSDGTVGLVKLVSDLPEDGKEFAAIKQRFLDYYRETEFKETKLFSEIADILELIEQHAVPWGVVTNKSAWLTVPLMKNLHLTDRAACIVSGDTTAHAKPHPEPLLHACKLINVNPVDCLYVGDAKRDIDAGNAAGMTTITAMYGYIQDLPAARMWGANYIVENTMELKQRIKTWLSR